MVDLAPSQRMFWLGHQAFPSAGLGNEAILLELEGPLQGEALTAALTALLERHPVLRSTYHLAPDETVRARVREPILALERIALPGGAPEQVAERIRARTHQRWDYAAHPCVTWQLFELGPERHSLVCYLPHLAMDGYSGYRTLPQDLVALYAQQLGGPALPPVERSYAEFAAAQLEACASADYAEHVGWWRARLEGSPTALELPTDRRRPPVVSTTGARVRRWVPVGELRALAERLSASLSDVLFAAWSVLLHRISGAEDIVVGVPIASRRPELRPVMGCMMNVLAVRVDLTGSPTFSQLIQRQQEAKRAAYPHRHVAIGHVQEAAARPGDPSRNPLYQVMFNFMNFIDELDGGGLTGRVVRHDVPTVIDLTLHPSTQGDELELMLEYSVALFLPQSAERLLGLLERLLEAVVADPERAIDRLPLLTPDERRWLLEELNDTAGPYPDQLLLHQPFEAQARVQPERVALLSASGSLTYRGLNERANRLAHHLRARGVGADHLVGICFERGFDLVVAMLAVLKAGGAYVPLDPAHPLERIRFTLEDTAAALVVTQASLSERLPDSAAHVVVDGADAASIAACATHDPEPIAAPDQRAYIIFTSGSTGRPKGVVVRHQPALNLTDWVNTTFEIGPDDRLLFVTSPCFDLSVYDVFGVLGAGGQVRVATSAELRDPDALVELLVRGGVTFWDSAPAALAQLVPFLPAGPAVQSALRLVFLSGDWIPVSLPDQLRAVFPHTRVISLGGATEATVWSNVYPIEEVDPTWKSIPYGRPIRNARYYVLDAHFEPTPIGVPGELFIGGPCLASGYHARPELNQERFLDDPFGDDEGGKLYRTGDMARVLADGNLEFLGRVDFQVKVRGYRIELEEIEAVLDQHPQVTRCIVMAPPDEAGERVLVAYVVPQGSLTRDAVQEHLAGRLPSYMIPSHVVLLDAIPLTSNGKVDRAALPQPARDAGAAYVAPRTAVEQEVARLWAEILKADRVGAQDHFFSLGGTSVRAARAVSAIRARFGHPLTLAEFYAHPTVGGLAAFLGQAQAREAIPRGSRPRARWPLAGPQLNIWYAQQQQPDSPGLYNVPLVVRMRGPLDLDAFRVAWEALVARHEPLRTTIDLSGDEPLQRVWPPGPIDLPFLDLTEHDPETRERLFEARLDVERERALDVTTCCYRVTLVGLEPEDHRLLFNQHHMLTDEWSVVVLVQELGALYRAALEGRSAELPALAIDYPDFALWEQERGGLTESEREYWELALEQIEPLELPRPYDPESVPAAGNIFWVVEDDLARAVEALCREEQATPFAGFLALFGAALARTYGPVRPSVTILAAMRERLELEGLLGCLVNMLPLGLDMSGAATFRALVRRVRDATTAVLQRRETPQQEVAALARGQGLDVGQLQQVVFSFLEAPDPIALAGCDWSWEVLEPDGVKFDLGLELLRRPTGLRVRLRYRPALLEPSSATRLGEALQSMIEAAAADPDAPFTSVRLLDPAERERLLTWSQTRVDYSREQGLAQRFEAQAQATPDRVALRSRDEEWTYAALDRRSNRLARRLREAGVERGTRVGILIPRSADYVSAVLGVLKAGGAFVPLDLDEPERRRAWIVNDASLAVGLTRRALADVPGVPAQLMFVDESSWEEGDDAAPLEPLSTANDPGYVTYTSGSTGTPKGVFSNQRGVLRLMLGPTYKELDPPSTWFLIAPLTFDTSIQQMFAPLLSGGTLVVLEERPSMEAIEEAKRLGADTLDLASGLFHTIVDERIDLLQGLRQVFVGGDVASPTHARRAVKAAPEVKIYNQYGPTECGIWSTAWRMGFETSGSVPIGKPLPNTRTYVLDAHMEPTPVGVAGELYLGGEGVAFGYLGRPELTAERFLPDPFSHEPEARMYRTGDLVRWREDGVLEFLGRADRQVKIRGFRVEPGEVEGALGNLPGVLQAAVDLRQGPGGNYLAGYVTPAELDTAELRALLEEALPAHLVPEQLMCLPELPLTSRGKLDRDRLPDPIAMRAGEFRAPRDDDERRMAAVWSDLLGAPVGIESDFFLQGGNSLLALRLASRIQREFGQPVPLAALLKHPTIASLCEHLRTDAGAVEERLAVCMQPGEGRPPLWLMHPVGGHALYARWLADRLDPDVPVYGIEARGLDGEREPFTCLIEMARQYLHELRVVQPEGPYYLGGYSLGGVIAFEMARQLRADGDEVALLLLIDAMAEGGVKVLPFPKRLRDLAKHLGELSPQERRAHLAERVRTHTRRLLGREPSSEAFPRYGLAHDPNLDPEQYDNVRRVIDASYLAATEYVFEPYEGHAHVLVATQRSRQPGRTYDEANGWRVWVRGGVEVIRIDCRHANMLDEPARTEVARQIRDLLARLHHVA